MDIKIRLGIYLSFSLSLILFNIVTNYWIIWTCLDIVFDPFMSSGLFHVNFLDQFISV